MPRDLSRSRPTARSLHLYEHVAAAGEHDKPVRHARRRGCELQALEAAEAALP